MAMTRNRAARSGTHPREARITESESPSADLPGPDLNEGIEEDSSAEDSKQTTEKDTDEHDLDHDPESRLQRTRETSRRNHKQTNEGSSRQQQPKVIDKGAGEEVKDWTKFDIGRSIRILRIGIEAQITRGFRLLHLRWWHTTRS